MIEKLKGLGEAVRSHRREVGRIALQTAAATAATYGILTWFGATQYLSWGIIAALFTIGMSADAAYYNALGRIGGSVLGTVLGLAAGALIGGDAVIGLLVAVTLANTVATVWPSLRYAAVIAAVVALDPRPELEGALEQATAIFIGTGLGALASFVVWPAFGRSRVIYSLRQALADCRTLLELIERGVRTDERHERDAAHARFLRNLQTARSRLAETRFSPRLPNGRRLREAANGVESLWHALVILDRAISDRRHALGQAPIERLEPALGEARTEASDFLGRMIGDIRAGRPVAPDGDALRRAIAGAREVAEGLAAEEKTLSREGKALQAIMFALDETEQSLLQLADTLGPQEDGEA